MPQCLVSYLGSSRGDRTDKCSIRRLVCTDLSDFLACQASQKNRLLCLDPSSLGSGLFLGLDSLLSGIVPDFARGHGSKCLGQWTPEVGAGRGPVGPIASIGLVRHVRLPLGLALEKHLQRSAAVFLREGGRVGFLNTGPEDQLVAVGLYCCGREKCRKVGFGGRRARCRGSTSLK